MYFLDYFNDVESTLSIRASLVTRWYDPCGWKIAKQRFPNSTSPLLVVKSQDIWYPFFTFHNSFQVVVDNENIPLFALEDGTVELWQASIWKFKCLQMRLRNFPFDSQRCTFQVDSWLLDDIVNITKVTFDTEEYRSQRDTSNDLWHVDLHNGSVESLHYKCVQSQPGTICSVKRALFQFILVRNWYPYYFYTIIVPMFTLVLTQLSAFCVPFNKIDRAFFSVTLSVAFAVTRTEIQAFIPISSENVIVLFAINLSLIGSMAATTYFSIIFMCQNSFNRQIPKSTFLLLDKIFLACFLLYYFVLYTYFIVTISE